MTSHVEKLRRGTVRYVVGDATRPQANGPMVLAHVCNDVGKVQFVEASPGLWVANMIGQHDVVAGPGGVPPVRYEAMRQALRRVGTFAREHAACVHMPRIGCGLAGGSWDVV